MKNLRSNKMITLKKLKKVPMIWQPTRRESTRHRLKVNSIFNIRNGGLKVKYKEKEDSTSGNKPN